MNRSTQARSSISLSSGCAISINALLSTQTLTGADVVFGPITCVAEAAPELAADVARWQGHGYPEDMARAFASLPFLAYALDIVEVAIERSLPVAEVAATYFSLSDALYTKWLMDAVEALPVDGRWHAQARGVLRDELQAQQRALVGQVLLAGVGLPAEERVERWLERDDQSLRYTMAMFADMRDLRDLDYPTLSVAVRRLAQVVASGAA